MIFKEYKNQNDQIEQLRLENELLRNMLKLKHDMHDKQWYALLYDLNTNNCKIIFQI